MTSHRIPHPLVTPARPRSISALALTLALACVSPAHAAPKKAPPVKPASQYAAFDAHLNEHLTIAAEPCTNSRDCDFFRLPYPEHGLIPVRVIFTNDGDAALSLDDVRIQFISANNDKIPAATLDDLNRRLFSTRDAMGTKIPLIPITIHHPPIDKKITEDDNDFGFQTTTVKPHSTLAGYLFYDVRDLDDPPLKSAELYVKMIRTADTKKELFPYTIPFNKWLAANQDQKPSKQATPVSSRDIPANP